MTDFHLFAYMSLIGRGFDVKINNPTGLAVTRLKSTDDLNDRKDDDDLTVYGLNSGLNMMLFNSSMTSVDLYEGSGRKYALKEPQGIAADADGNVFIADTGHDRIMMLRNPGNYVEFVKTFGEEGTAAGEFSKPSQVALDAEGHLYVSDTGNHRIQVFNRDGDFLYMLGSADDTTSGQPRLFKPMGITVVHKDEPYLEYRESFIVVIDLNNQRIQKFSLTGEFLGGIYSEDFGYQSVYLMYAAADLYSNIWVTDLLNHCIHKFDRNLNYVTSFGSVGHGEYQFFEPRGIAIFKRFGQVLVVDKNSGQYFHIGTDVLETEVTSRADSAVQLSFFLTEDATVTVEVFDESEENLIRTLTRRKLMHTGRNSVVWDKKVASGKKGRALIDLIRKNVVVDSLIKSALDTSASSSIKTSKPVRTDSLALGSAPAVAGTLPSGIYWMIIKAKPTYSSKKHFEKTVRVRIGI